LEEYRREVKMNNEIKIAHKGFYLLEYFFILLRSIEKYSEQDKVFGEFKILKKQNFLGESKYKRKFETDEPSKTQQDRYHYTFREVIEEAKTYDLIEQDALSNLRLTVKGLDLLKLIENQGVESFNNYLFTCMEQKHGTFRSIIERLYAKNQYKPGLLIFPNYSPRQLDFERSNVKTVEDIIRYSHALTAKLQEDISSNLGLVKDMSPHNKTLINRLVENKLLPSSPSEDFNPIKYNVIIKRFRDFWMNYFLKEIYGFDIPLTTFDRWIYRGKQIGIIYATEFYPYFSGRIVYPTSVVVSKSASQDFNKLFNYEDGKSLYIHKPKWNDANQDKFVNALVTAYFDLRRTYRSYFINLLAMRELVCYSMKISERLFETFLDEAYKLNLADELKIKISLEVDRLPEETTAMYLKQEPVMVDKKYRNIIAINVTPGDRFDEQAA